MKMHISAHENNGRISSQHAHFQISLVSAYIFAKFHLVFLYLKEKTNAMLWYIGIIARCVPLICIVVF